jgi:hypothetical protein
LTVIRDQLAGAVMNGEHLDAFVSEHTIRDQVVAEHQLSHVVVDNVPNPPSNLWERRRSVAAKSEPEVRSPLPWKSERHIGNRFQIV